MYTGSLWIAVGAFAAFAAATVAGCAATPPPAPKVEEKKLEAAEAELDKVLYEQHIVMVKTAMNESDAAMKKGDYLTGAARLGQAVLAYPKAYAQVAGPKDWHYAEVQRKFSDAIKRVPTAPVMVKNPDTKVVEVIRTVEAPPDPVDQSGIRQAVARGDALAKKGDHRGALREYLQAMRYPRAPLPSDLADKCNNVIAKIGQASAEPATPTKTEIITAQPGGSADDRRRLADKLRPQAQRLADAIGVEDLKKARSTYTALMGTGYYTADDVKRLHELQVKLDRATTKTIFDD